MRLHQSTTSEQSYWMPVKTARPSAVIYSTAKIALIPGCCLISGRLVSIRVPSKGRVLKRGGIAPILNTE